MSNWKKAVDRAGLDLKTKRRLNSTNPRDLENVTGVAGDKIIESVPKFISTPSEVVYQNDNGSFVVLGRDRNAGRLSGYGGKGDTQCASIDIVVGRMGSSPKVIDNDGNAVFADPNFKLDSARIYITQKGDIDDYFELKPGSNGNTKAKSGIGMKADKIVLAAREGIKLVSGLDSFNSQGAAKIAKYGIELLANNDDTDVQPIPKGGNLRDFLEELLEHIDELNGAVETLYRNQMIINSVLLAHTHLSSIPGTPTAPSIEVLAIATGPLIDMEVSGYTSLLSNKVNSTVLKYNFLVPVSSRYINSRNNKTN